MNNLGVLYIIFMKGKLEKNQSKKIQGNINIYY